MPQRAPPEKRVRITTIKDQPERSVADYLKFRPAPLQPPVVPDNTHPERGSPQSYAVRYEEYLECYRAYLASLSVIRKEFKVVFLDGGHYDSSPKVAPPHVVGEKPVTFTAPNLPFVTAVPRTPDSPEKVEAKVAASKVRKQNKRARAKARKAAAQREASSLPAKVVETTQKVQLVKAELSYAKALASQKRAEKRAKATSPPLPPAPSGNPPQAGTPSAAAAPQGGGAPNRRARRYAIYGPPAQQ